MAASRSKLLKPEHWAAIRNVWEYDPDEPYGPEAAARAAQKHGFTPPSRQAIHECMPVILGPEQWDPWLDPKCEDIGLLREMLAPYDAEQMAAYPVSQRVGSTRHEGADLLEPLTQE